MTRIGIPLTAAGAVLLAGMIAVALTLPVRGSATWYVWLAVAAVAAGPLWNGLILIRSNVHQVPNRLVFPTAVSTTLAAAAGLSVRDRYVTHPETPFTASTVAYCVIAVLSVLLTFAAALAFGPRASREESRTRAVDAVDPRHKGLVAAVAGGLAGAWFSVTSWEGISSLTLLGVVVAGCATVAGIVLTRAADPRAGRRNHLVLSGLLLIALISLVLVAPVVYALFVSSVIGGVLYAVMFLGALTVILWCGTRLPRQHGVLAPDEQVAR